MLEAYNEIIAVQSETVSCKQNRDPKTVFLREPYLVKLFGSKQWELPEYPHLLSNVNPFYILEVILDEQLSVLKAQDFGR